jgi:hypothetical protein
MSIFNLEKVEYEKRGIAVNLFNPTLLRGRRKTSKDLDTFKNKACELYEAIKWKEERITETKKNAFAFVLLHLMSLISEYQSEITEIVIEREEGTKIIRKTKKTLKKIPSCFYPSDKSISNEGKLTPYWDGYKAFNKTSLSILFSFHKGGTKDSEDEERIPKYYWYRDKHFGLETLQTVVKLLSKQKILPAREGFCFKKDNGDNSFRYCLLIFNYPTLEGFYTKNKSLIDRLLYNIELTRPQFRRDIESLISIRVNKKEVDVRKYRKRKDVTESIDYLLKLIEMYESLSVSLQDPKSVDAETLNSCISEIEFKKSQKSDTTPFNIEDFSSEVREWNKCLLQNNKFPRRVFHIEGKEWVWGRIHRNLGVNSLPREFQKLVLIDGKPTSQIDMVSAVPQLFFTVYVDSTKYKKPKDFYSFKSIEGLPIFQSKEDTREKVKMIFQCCINNPSEDKAYKAFHGKFKSFKKVDFLNVVSLIQEETPWLKTLFFKNFGKKLIRIESDFFLEAGKKLIKQQIKFIHHFDSIFVLREDKDKAMVILKEVGRTMFKSELDFKVK